MKILMIAPEPFFQERGTPLSEFYRIKALIDLGHQVDLLTYPLGKKISLTNLKIIRIPKLPFLKKIKIGPSWTKLPLDFLLLLKSFSLVIKNHYDIIHTHEEAGLIGALIKIIFRKTHIFDMHSSLSEQFINFNITKNKFFLKIIKTFEKLILAYSDCTIAICKDIQEKALNLKKNCKVLLIENTFNPEFLPYFSTEEKEALPSFNKDKKIALYIGTFEYYQGLDIIIEAAKYLKERSIDYVLFACLGAENKHLQFLSKYIEKEGLKEMFFLYKRISPATAYELLKQADVLLSPRKAGNNTPLKIYTYMQSGKPIIATNLLTHTQVLNNSNAFLAEPNGKSFALAILEALNNKEKSKKIASTAKENFNNYYSYPIFKEKVKLSIEMATKS